MAPTRHATGNAPRRRRSCRPLVHTVGLRPGLLRCRSPPRAQCAPECGRVVGRCGGELQGAEALPRFGQWAKNVGSHENLSSGREGRSSVLPAPGSFHQHVMKTSYDDEKKSSVALSHILIRSALLDDDRTHHPACGGRSRVNRAVEVVGSRCCKRHRSESVRSCSCRCGRTGNRR